MLIFLMFLNMRSKALKFAGRQKEHGRKILMNGRILTDEDTCRSEEAITENVLAIAAQVSVDGSFWESEVAS